MGKIIGITGGIASGKSTVTNFLRKQGFQVVDADSLVHQLQKPGGRLFEALVQHFGQEIILENGELNRPLLASLIFSNEIRYWLPLSRLRSSMSLSNRVIQPVCLSTLPTSATAGTCPPPKNAPPRMYPTPFCSRE